MVMNRQTTNEVKKELLRIAEHSGCPIDILFELTGRCNFDCKMCYVHTMKNSDALQKELSYEQWISIFDQALSAGMAFATLTGGECLLRTDFRQLYLYLYERMTSITVKTNALLLTEDYLSFFKQYPPQEVQVSLYGSNEDEYQAVTGMFAFSVASKNIEALSKSGLNYRVTLTPCEEAKGFFTNIIDYASEHHYTFSISQLILPARDDSKDNRTDSFVEDICEYQSYLAVKNGRSLVPYNGTDLPKPGTCGDHIKEAMHCTAGKNRAMIDWKGDMHPCIALPSLASSVLSQSFSDAWREIRKQVDALCYPAKCASCCYKNLCKPCYAVRCIPEQMSTCNESACKLVQAQIQRGLRKFSVEDL